MRDSEIKALLFLLTDPDESIYEAVSTKIMSDFEKVKEQLIEEIHSSNDELFLSRANKIVNKVKYTKTYNELSKWIYWKDRSFINGYFLINRFLNFELEIHFFYNFLVNLRRKIKFDIYNLTPLEQARYLNFIVNKELNLKVKNEQNFSLWLFSDIMATGFACSAMLVFIAYIIGNHLDMPITLLRVNDEFFLGYKDLNAKQPLMFNFFFYPNKSGAILTLDEFRTLVKNPLKIVTPESFVSFVITKIADIAVWRKDIELFKQMQKFLEILQNEKV